MSAWTHGWRRSQDAGLHADAIYAETAALPVTPNGVTLLIDGARVYVRRENTPGAVLEVEPLIEALQLALASGEESREHVTIYVSEDDYERERELLEGLREFTASLQLKLLPDGPLPLLAANIAQSAPVNLLQGRTRPRRKLQCVVRAVALCSRARSRVPRGASRTEVAGSTSTTSSAEAQLDAQIARGLSAGHARRAGAGSAATRASRSSSA